MQPEIDAMLASTAFTHALRGRAVFRLAAGSKKPFKDSHGLSDATREVDVVRAWWGKAGRSNIGIATGPQSGFWALDIDPKHGGDKSLEALTERNGNLPATVAVLTPSGGMHMWWKWREDGPEIRNSASRVGPGIDVRGAGGYVISPPSVLRNGRRYCWIEGRREILHAPDWLVALTLPPQPPQQQRESKPLNGDPDRYAAAAIADELRQLGQVREGIRNDQLNRAAFNIAGFVLSGSVPAEWARAELENRAVAAGLSLLEARRTIESAFKAAKPRDLPR